MIFGRCAKVAICAVLFAHPSILRGNALSDCARIFEAEIREGVVHGAAVVAGGLENGNQVSSVPVDLKVLVYVGPCLGFCLPKVGIEYGLRTLGSLDDSGFLGAG